MSWTTTDIARLRALARGDLFATEIAEQLGKSAGAVRYKLRRLGLDPAARAKRSGRLGQWNAKHAHLRRPVLEFYLTHSAGETQKKFGLTAREFKSLLTVSYRDPKMTDLRKDTRRHDPWSFDEIVFLLRHAGLRERRWIAAKLNRGGVDAVKEMVARLGANTRYINGLPKRLAEELVGHEVHGFKVNAGPDGRHAGIDCRPIIVPWVRLYYEAKRSQTTPAHLVDALRAMARFQQRIHSTRGILDTVASVERAIGGES